MKGPTARRRASQRARQLRHDRKVYAEVDALDGLRCLACGLYCGASIHRHHVIYRSRGGPTTVENVVSVCKHCHADIHAKLIYPPKRVLTPV